MANEKEEALTVKFVDKPQKGEPKPVMDVLDGALDKIVRFVDTDIDAVVDYLEMNNVPAHYITPGKRIDLHPAREYLLRVPRTMREVIGVKKMMDNDDDELDRFFD